MQVPDGRRGNIGRPRWADIGEQDAEGVIEGASTDWTSPTHAESPPAKEERSRRSINEIECIERLREKFRNVKEPKQIFGPTNEEEEGAEEAVQDITAMTEESILSNRYQHKELRKRSLLTSKQMEICQKIKQVVANSQAREQNSENSPDELQGKSTRTKEPGEAASRTFQPSVHLQSISREYSMKSPGQHDAETESLFLQSQSLFSHNDTDQELLAGSQFKSVRRSNVDEHALPALISPAGSGRPKDAMSNIDGSDGLFQPCSLISNNYTPFDQPSCQKKESVDDKTPHKLSSRAVKVLNQQYQERFFYTNPRKNRVLGYRARRAINPDEGPDGAFSSRNAQDLPSQVSGVLGENIRQSDIESPAWTNNNDLAFVMGTSKSGWDCDEASKHGQPRTRRGAPRLNTVRGPTSHSISQPEPAAAVLLHQLDKKRQGD